MLIFFSDIKCSPCMVTTYYFFFDIDIDIDINILNIIQNTHYTLYKYLVDCFFVCFSSLDTCIIMAKCHHYY